MKQAILKAYEAAKRCSDACADADAMVATYWMSDGVSITPNHWGTQHLRDAASLVHSLAHSMLVKTDLVCSGKTPKFSEPTYCEPRK